MFKLVFTYNILLSFLKLFHNENIKFSHFYNGYRFLCEQKIDASILYGYSIP